jgi:N-acetylglucosaminyldiphosphoundecaprenol N-acetyl-beta-D-mannosaminyltransferase
MTLSQAKVAEPVPDGHALSRVDVLGVGISAIDMNIALARISSWVDQRSQHYVCITGVHGVMESQRDPELLRIHNQSGLTTPDGMPMVWAGRFAGARWMRRVYGPDLVMALAALASEQHWRLFLYGGKPGVADLLADHLRACHPGVQVVGTYSPPFRSLSTAEGSAVHVMINAAQPDIVLVGLSTPKQERWMATHVGRVEAPVLIGVGAAFDLLTGQVSQAPRWMQRSGLEWLYRFAQEPRRLGPRYLRANPAFVIKILRRPPRLVPDGVSVE